VRRGDHRFGLMIRGADRNAPVLLMIPGRPAPMVLAEGSVYGQDNGDSLIENLAVAEHSLLDKVHVAAGFYQRPEAFRTLMDRVRTGI
jgi:hypothetical protein